MADLAGPGVLAQLHLMVPDHGPAYMLAQQNVKGVGQVRTVPQLREARGLGVVEEHAGKRNVFGELPAGGSLKA